DKAHIGLRSVCLLDAAEVVPAKRRELDVLGRRELPPNGRDRAPRRAPLVARILLDDGDPPLEAFAAEEQCRRTADRGAAVDHDVRALHQATLPGVRSVTKRPPYPDVIVMECGATIRRDAVRTRQ